MVVVALMVVYANMLQYPLLCTPNIQNILLWQYLLQVLKIFQFLDVFKCCCHTLRHGKRSINQKWNFLHAPNCLWKIFHLHVRSMFWRTTWGQVMSDSQRLPNNFVIVFCGLPRELYILKASGIKRSTFLEWNYRLSSLLCREIAHVLFILLEKLRKNNKENLTLIKVFN